MRKLGLATIYCYAEGNNVVDH